MSRGHAQYLSLPTLLVAPQLSAHQANRYCGLNLSLLTSQLCTDHLLEQKCHSKPFQASHQGRNLGCNSCPWSSAQYRWISSIKKYQQSPQQKMQVLSCVEEKNESEFGILCIIHQTATRPAMKPPPRTQCWEYSLSSKFFSS